MTRVVFVCHGNICRSPMAEFIFRQMLAERGGELCVDVASRATSREEIWGNVGNPIYPPAQACLRAHGVPFDGRKRAEQLTAADCSEYDWVIAMDGNNVRNILKMYPTCVGKVRKLMDFAGGGDVEDPWYTGNFERVYRDISKGCEALLAYLKAHNQ